MATIEQPAETKQTQRPGAPSEVRALQFEDKRPDVSKLTEFAGKAYKDSITNWNYYLKNEWKKQSDEAVAQFGDNPAQLMGALEKIRTSMLPEDTPKQIRDSFLEDTYYDSASIMNKAQTNYNTRQRKETKANAGIYADGLTDDIATSYFNVLTYNTAPAEEKRPMDLEIYVKQRADLAKLADLTDDDGNFYFSETQRKNMKNPSEAILNGFRDFIYRPELKQLQEWDKKIFQNRDEFMKSTGIDGKTYDSMEKLLKQRMKDLKDTETREIHGQAFYEASALITDPIQTNIDKAKTDGIIPNKTIDKIVKASEEATKTTYYYDPKRKTSPGAFMNALANLTETVNTTDWSPDGREKAIGEAAESMLYLSALAKETNMSPELVDKVKHAIRTTLTNKEAAETLDLTSSQFKNNMYDYAGHIDYARFGREDLTTSAAKKTKEVALQNFETNILNAMNSFIIGDLETYKTQVAEADTQYKIDLVGFMPYSSAQWKQWQKDVDSGKDVVIEYMGNMYKFNGFNSKEPLTLINLI